MAGWLGSMLWTDNDYVKMTRNQIAKEGPWPRNRYLDFMRAMYQIENKKQPVFLRRILDEWPYDMVRPTLAELTIFLEEGLKRGDLAQLANGMYYVPEEKEITSPLSPRIRFQILQRDDYRCRLCGTAARDGAQVRLEVDHITPRSKGGTNDPSNLWVLCFDCNRGKWTRSL